MAFTHIFNAQVSALRISGAQMAGVNVLRTIHAANHHHSKGFTPRSWRQSLPFCSMKTSRSSASRGKGILGTSSGRTSPLPEASTSSCRALCFHGPLMPKPEHVRSRMMAIRAHSHVAAPTSPHCGGNLPGGGQGTRRRPSIKHGSNCSCNANMTGKKNFEPKLQIQISKREHVWIMAWSSTSKNKRFFTNQTSCTFYER